MPSKRNVVPRLHGNRNSYTTDIGNDRSTMGEPVTLTYMQRTPKLRVGENSPGIPAISIALR